MTSPTHRPLARRAFTVYSSQRWTHRNLRRYSRRLHIFRGQLLPNTMVRAYILVLHPISRRWKNQTTGYHRRQRPKTVASRRKILSRYRLLAVYIGHVCICMNGFAYTPLSPSFCRRPGNLPRNESRRPDRTGR